MEIATPSAIAGLSIDRDLTRGTYTLRGFGAECELRPWTFGERRRLVQACAADGGFDERRFVAEFVALVYTPHPPDGLMALFAHVALSLFGIGEGELLPLTEADAWLARELRILPSQSDLEPAPELDRLIREQRVVEAPVAVEADVQRRGGR